MRWHEILHLRILKIIERMIMLLGCSEHIQQVTTQKDSHYNQLVQTCKPTRVVCETAGVRQQFLLIFFLTKCYSLFNWRVAKVYYAFVHVRAEHRFINKRSSFLTFFTATVSDEIRQFQAEIMKFEDYCIWLSLVSEVHCLNCSLQFWSLWILRLWLVQLN